MPAVDQQPRTKVRRKTKRGPQGLPTAAGPKPKTTTVRGPQGLPTQRVGAQAPTTIKQTNARADRAAKARARGPQGLPTSRRDPASQKAPKNHSLNAIQNRDREAAARSALAKIRAKGGVYSHVKLDKRRTGDPLKLPEILSESAKGLNEVAKGIQHGVSAVQDAGSKAGSKLPGFKSTPGIDKLGGYNSDVVVKDATDLVANMPTSMFLSGKAVVRAAQGDTRTAAQLWKDYKKTSAIPAAVSGNWSEAAKRANAHPVSTGLELSGLKASIGRTTGATLRTVGKAGTNRVAAAAKRAGSTERPNLRLAVHAGKGQMEIKRDYSKDTATKLAQVTRERRLRKRGIDPHVDRGARANPALPKGRKLTQGSGPARLQSTAPRPKLRRDVDTVVAGHETVRRGRIDEARHEVGKVVPTPRGSRFPGATNRRTTAKPHEGAAVQLHVEGVIRRGSERKDLEKHYRALVAASRHIEDPELRRQNAAARKSVREVLNLPDDRLTFHTAKAAAEFRELQKPVQERGRSVGAYDEAGQSKRFMPALQTHAKVPKGIDKPGLSRDLSAPATIASRRSALQSSRLTPEERAVAQRVISRRKRQGKDVPSKPVSQLRRNPRLIEARQLSSDELTQVARTLQRRNRQGKATLSGMPEGGPSMVTQRPPRLGPNGEELGVYQPQTSVPRTPSKTRKGGAFVQGTREVGSDALVRQHLTSEATVTAAEGFQHLGRRYGINATPTKRYASTPAEALHHARNLMESDPAGLELVPVNMAAFQQFGSKLRRAQEEGHPESAALKDTWHLATEESGRGKYVLMPKEVVDRLKAHAEVRSNTPLSGMTNWFKDVVLTTANPAGWMMGNATDLSSRSAMAGITPREMALGRRGANAMKDQGYEGELAEAVLTGGGLFTTGNAIGRSFAPTAIGEHSLHTMAAAPWRLYKGAIYGLEHHLEQLPQQGVLGKEMRRNGTKGSLLKLQKATDAQIEHFAKNLTLDTSHQRQIQLAVEDVIGRWGKVSPSMRQFLGLAPFAQWLGAATRYVYHTLPVRHPLKTGIMSSISQMTSEERQRLGLSYMLPQDQRAQDYQMGMLPTKVEKTQYGLKVKGIPTQKFSSFGTAGSLPDVKGFILPQVMGPLNAFSGLAFTGEKMKYPDWWPDKKLRGIELSKEDKIKVGLGMLLESIVPFAGNYRRNVLDKGGPSEPYSNILMPGRRKVMNYDTGQWEDRPGTTSVGGGLKHFVTPFKDQTVYTNGAERDIERSQITTQTLHEWQDKKKSGKGTASPYDDNNVDTNPYYENSIPKKKKKGKESTNPYATEPSTNSTSTNPYAG